jgi:hypothetical protein
LNEVEDGVGLLQSSANLAGISVCGWFKTGADIDVVVMNDM